MDRDYITIIKESRNYSPDNQKTLNKPFLSLNSLLPVTKDAKQCFFGNVIIHGVICLPVHNFMILNVLTSSRKCTQYLSFSLWACDSSDPSHVMIMVIIQFVVSFTSCSRKSLC